MDAHLTDTPQNIRDTPPGMAFWQGSGPTGMRCQDCAFFMGNRKTGALGVEIVKEGRCKKYIKLVGRGGRAPVFPLPAATPACKYFEPR